MDRLSNSIKCVNCRMVLEAPVILPCGNSICKKHTTTTNSQTPILCHTCGIEHPIPANGFLPNNALAEMISIQIANLDFGNVHKEAKQSCQQFDELLTNIDQLINDPFNFTYEPIDYLISVVQLKGEEMILEINEKMNRMIEEVTDKKDRIIGKLLECKLECKKDLGEKEYVEKSENFRKENEIGRKQLDEWLATLNEIKVNEQEWKRIKSESENFIKYHENKLVAFKMDFFPKRFNELQAEIEKDFGKFEVDSSFDLWSLRIELESVIVNEPLKSKLLELCGFKTNTFKLLYRGSLHGFAASNFHEKCDHKDKTLTIIKAADSGNIFGGYTDIAWQSDSRTKLDENAFIFSLVNKEKTPVKVDISKEKSGKEKYAIYGCESYGPVFGNGSDIVIVENSNSSDKNYSNFGGSYQLPKYPIGSEAAKTFLAGSYNFKVDEIEVFLKQ